MTENKDFVVEIFIKSFSCRMIETHYSVILPLCSLEDIIYITKITKEKKMFAVFTLKYIREKYYDIFKKYASKHIVKYLDDYLNIFQNGIMTYNKFLKYDKILNHCNLLGLKYCLTHYLNYVDINNIQCTEFKEVLVVQLMLLDMGLKLPSGLSTKFSNIFPIETSTLNLDKLVSKKMLNNLGKNITFEKFISMKSLITDFPAINGEFSTVSFKRYCYEISNDLKISKDHQLINMELIDNIYHFTLDEHNYQFSRYDPLFQLLENSFVCNNKCFYRELKFIVENYDVITAKINQKYKFKHIFFTSSLHIISDKYPINPFDAVIIVIPFSPDYTLDKWLNSIDHWRKVTKIYFIIIYDYLVTRKLKYGDFINYMREYSFLDMLNYDFPFDITMLEFYSEEFIRKKFLKIINCAIQTYITNINSSN